jgi:hypothetical protein
MRYPAGNDERPEHEENWRERQIAPLSDDE